MKHLYALLFLLAVSSSAFAQNNTTGNGAARQEANGFACGDSTFWAVEASGLIDEFTLRGDTAIYKKVVLSNVPGLSIAFTNNLDGNSYSPTFYCCYKKQVYYYNGNTWTQTATSPTDEVLNCGSDGGHVYFQVTQISVPGIKIVSYDGSTYKTIYNDPASYLLMADLATDANGNVYLMKGDTNTVSKVIDVISPAGQIVKEYPFVRASELNFGMFVLNNTMYVGVGLYNSFSFTDEDSILPITFSGNTATMGRPIPLPEGPTYYDMANCSAASVLGVQNIMAGQTPVTAYPNPVADNLLLTTVTSAPTTVKVVNMLGSQVYYKTNVQGNTTVNVSQWPNGLYLVQMQSNNSSSLQKVEVRH